MIKILWRIARDIKRVDVFRYHKCDHAGSIFHTSGDQAIPYCHAYEGAVRMTYTDGSCLYPDDGDIIVTFKDGQRRLFK